MRLTGGTTRSYTRIERGHPQRVRQYRTPHPAQAQVGGLGSVPRTQVPWNKLQPGMVVDFSGQAWKVIKTSVFTHFQLNTKNKAGKPSRKGTRTGAQTGSGTATGSPGKAAKAHAKKAAKPSTSAITDRLENLNTGKRVDITLQPGFKVWVY